MIAPFLPQCRGTAERRASTSIDPELAAILSIDAKTSTVESYGNATSSQSCKLCTVIDGKARSFFLKISVDGDMCRGEHASLLALRSIVPSLCPLSIAYGRLSNSPHHFLLTEFIDMNKHEHYTGHIPSFARKLAQLHSAPAPIPEGYLQPMFGFHVTTFAGTISQLNTYKRSWSEFYTNNRLLNICSIIRGKYHGEEDLTARVEQIAIQVVPRLLEAGHLGGLHGIRPVVVHGDLWIENTCRGVLGEEGNVEDFAFDASSCYAHSEYELGIMRMFGGFGDRFFNEYHCLVPKTEPQDEYEDRMELYQLYHWLINYAVSRDEFRGEVLNSIERLWQKYGSDEGKSGQSPMVRRASI